MFGETLFDRSGGGAGVKPDQSLFTKHLGEAPFQSGSDSGHWGIANAHSNIAWPNAILWVVADPQIVPAGKLFLKFDLQGYPEAAPTSFPWDIEKSTRLENDRYPKLTGTFAKVFRVDWMEGKALYAPCDRLAMPGHETWQGQFPFWWWQPHFTIVNYLKFVRLCLNPIQYEYAAA